MNINPRVEPWLRALLDGVENSNHSAEMVATAAYDACRDARKLDGFNPAEYLRQKAEMI